LLRAVVFDVDGTLVDSVDLHARCWQEAFARYGRQLPLQKIRNQIGKGGDLIIPTFFPEEEVERWGEELDQYRSELFREEYLQRVRPFPGVRELFERIRADGKHVALASSGKESEVEHYLELLGVGELIDGMTTGDQAARSKPFPDIFAAALAQLGVSPAEAVVVGDSPFDAEAAGRLGSRVVCVLCGGFDPEDLRHAGCSSFFRDPEDLLLRYDQSPLSQDGLRADLRWSPGSPPGLG
jgi:HAD superfamily hydrolase (TIGR01509 family)